MLLYVKDAETGRFIALSLVLVNEASSPSQSVYSLGISDLGGPTQQFGYQQVTDLSEPTPLPNLPSAATQATINVEGAAIRYRLDGGTPTASYGMPIEPGSNLVINGSELPGFMAIEQDEGAILNIIYEG